MFKFRAMHNLPHSIETNRCAAHISVTSMSLVGAGVVEEELFHSLTLVFKPVLSRLFLSPMLCISAKTVTNSLGLLVGGVDGLVTAVAEVTKYVVPRQSIRHMEKKARHHMDKNKNPPLVEDYSKNFLFEDLQAVLNEGLGEGHHRLVLDQVIDQYLAPNGKVSHQFNRIPLGSLLVLGETIAFALDKVQVYGLDAVSTFHLLEPTSNFTFHNHLGLDGPIGVKVDFEVTCRDSPPLVMQFEVGIKELDLVVDLLVSLSRKKIGEVFLGTLLDVLDRPGDALECILSMTNALALPCMVFKQNSMVGPFFFPVKHTKRSKDQLPQILDTLLDYYLVSPFFPGLKSLLHKDADKIANVILSPSLLKITSMNHTSCKAPSPLPSLVKPSHFVDFSKSKVIELIHWGISTVVGTEGPFNINAILDILLHHMSTVQKHHIYKQGYLMVDKSVKLGPIPLEALFPSLHNDSLATVWVGNLSVGPLSVLDNFELLEPVSKMGLNNDMVFMRGGHGGSQDVDRYDIGGGSEGEVKETKKEGGNTNKKKSKGIEVIVDVAMNISNFLEDRDKTMINHLRLQINLAQRTPLMVQSVVNLLLDLSQVAQMKVKQLLHPCVFMLVGGIKIEEFNMALGGVKLQAWCREGELCNAPMADEMVEW